MFLKGITGNIIKIIAFCIKEVRRRRNNLFLLVTYDILSFNGHIRYLCPFSAATRTVYNYPPEEVVPIL